MRGVMININVLLVIVASSYLTLGIFNPDKAGDLWALYGIVTFVIAVSGLLYERHLNGRE